MLKTDHLTRIVSGKRLVDDINIEIDRGEVLAVVGPSGAGKSSFLRLLNRLDEPTSGTVWLAGQDYRQIAPRELRRRIGMVMQTAHLFPGTIADNIRFGPGQHGIEVSSEAVASLLEQVGLPGRADADVIHLSGGEAQRVSLARALANSPIVLLLDEPTSSLDQAAKEAIQELIMKIVRQNALTCVIVSHDVAQAVRMGKRIMLLNNGKLEKIGSASEVFNVEGTVL